MKMEKGIKLSEVYRGLLLDFQTKKTTREEAVKKLLIIADKLVEFTREEEAEKNRPSFNWTDQGEVLKELKTLSDLTRKEEEIDLKNITGLVMIPKDKKNG